MDTSEIIRIIRYDLGVEQITERWKQHGYSIRLALEAAESYSEWAGEDIAFDVIDDAITGSNESGGIFTARVEAWFSAWKQSRTN